MNTTTYNHAAVPLPAAQRKTLTPDQFYIPRQQETGNIGLQQRRAQWMPATNPQEAVNRPAPMREHTDTAARNIVTCSAASGGIGTTTTAAMLAYALAKQHAPIALIDADLRVAGGGIDVMLGLEHERGVRWHEVNAPLGQLNGVALVRQLPQWSDVSVLSHNPWQGESPQWWEVQAAVQALSQATKAVIVDAGHGAIIEQVATLVEASHVVFVELSVMGLARAQMHIAWLEQIGLRSVEQRNVPPRIGQEVRPMTQTPGQIIAIVGMEPQGAARARGVVSVTEASTYLDHEVIGPIRTDTRLCSDMLEGLGIRTIPRKHARVMQQIGGIVEHACSLDRPALPR